MSDELRSKRAIDGAAIGWTVLLSLVLIGHFFVTAVWVGPSNPLRISMLPLASWYLEPFFSQTWTLFAPDPLRSSDYVYVSCRIDGGTNEPYETNTSDVSTRFYEAHQKYRLGPAIRLLRAQMRPLTLVAGQKDELTSYILSQRDDPPAELKDLVRDVVAQTESGYAAGVRAFARVASAECARLYPTKRITHVNPSWVLVDPPPFTERHRPIWEGQIKRLDFGWHRFEQVAPYEGSQS